MKVLANPGLGEDCIEAQNTFVDECLGCRIKSGEPGILCEQLNVEKAYVHTVGRSCNTFMEGVDSGNNGVL